MEAGSTSVERLLAAAVATMEKARYCWAMTVAEDGSVNARPMGPQKSPASEDPFGILFLTRRGSRKALEIGRTGRLSAVYQHDADDSYVTLIGRGVIIADRTLLRARWQPAWNQFFPAGVDDETAIFVQLEADRIELWVRGVTPEPFGTRGAILAPYWSVVHGSLGAWSKADELLVVRPKTYYIFAGDSDIPIDLLPPKIVLDDPANPFSLIFSMRTPPSDARSEGARRCYLYEI